MLTNEQLGYRQHLRGLLHPPCQLVNLTKAQFSRSQWTAEPTLPPSPSELYFSFSPSRISESLHSPLFHSVADLSWLARSSLSCPISPYPPAPTGLLQSGKRESRNQVLCLRVRGVSLSSLNLKAFSLCIWTQKSSAPFLLALNSKQYRSGLESRSDIRKSYEDLPLKKVMLGEDRILRQRGPLSCRNNDPKAGQDAHLSLRLTWLKLVSHDLRKEQTHQEDKRGKLQNWDKPEQEEVHFMIRVNN